MTYFRLFAFYYLTLKKFNMKNPNIKKSTLTKTDKVLIPIILIIFFLVGSYVLAVVLEAIELITK